LPIIYKVLAPSQVPGGAGFLPSTVCIFFSKKDGTFGISLPGSTRKGTRNLKICHGTSLQVLGTGKK